MQFGLLNMNLYNFPIHKKSPYFVNALIEIPRGSSAKYEYHPDGYFFYDRSLMSAMSYPANYGFIPSTLADDGDALDVLVYNSTPIDRGTIVECKVIGVLDMDDECSNVGCHKDYKILATPTSHVRNYESLNCIDPMFLSISKNFFTHYKELNNKKTKIYEWHEKEKAFQIIDESMKLKQNSKDRRCQ